MANEKTVGRRRYSADLKARVVTECEVPGASVAKVAMAHGINANIVHGWRKLNREAAGGPTAAPCAATVPPAATFVPIALPMAASAPGASAADIRIEIKRGTTTVNVAWPTSSAEGCTAWLRELLR